MTRFSYAWFSAARANARAPRKSLSFSLCTFATKTVLEEGKVPLLYTSRRDGRDTL